MPHPAECSRVSLFSAFFVFQSCALRIACVYYHVFCDVCTCYVVSVVRTCGCVRVLCACYRRGGLKKKRKDEDGDIEEEREQRATEKYKSLIVMWSL